MVDDNLIGEVIDLSDGEVHRVSIRLDPAFYADHNIEVSIQESTGYDAVISEINLIDIDYRYADSGGENDPAYPSSSTLAYGWLDGVENTPWGVLPFQSRRIDLSDANPDDDPDNELRYQFDGLDSEKSYKLALVFFQKLGGTVNQTIFIDEIEVDTITLDGEDRIDKELDVPTSAYQDDGAIVVIVQRQGALAGAFVSEIALEEMTLTAGTIPPTDTPTPTPSKTLTETATPTDTPTPTDTLTPSNTPTDTPMPSDTPTKHTPPHQRQLKHRYPQIRLPHLIPQRPPIRPHYPLRYL